MSIFASVVLCGVLILVSTAFAEDEQILLLLSAKGTQMSGLFTAKDHWEVRWKGDEGLSIITFDREGNRIAAIAYAEHGGGGSASQEQGGTYSLKVISEGAWTVTVVQQP
ncbi:MAG: hypothetical protein H8K03_13765 [Nitrospira sp.]